MPVDDLDKNANPASHDEFSDHFFGNDEPGLPSLLGDDIARTDIEQEPRKEGRNIREDIERAKKFKEKHFDKEGAPESDDNEREDAGKTEEGEEGEAEERAKPGKGPASGGSASEKPAGEGAEEGTTSGGQEAPSEAGSSLEDKPETRDADLNAQSYNQAHGSDPLIKNTGGPKVGASSVGPGEKAITKGVVPPRMNAARDGAEELGKSAGKAALKTGAKAVGEVGKEALIEGGLEVGEDLLAAPTLGISEVVGRILQAAVLAFEAVNKFLKKHHLDLASLLEGLVKNSSKATIGFVIIFTILGTLGISAVGFGAANGDHGRSEQVASEAQANETQAIFAAMKQGAKSNVTLGGITGTPSIPGVPGGGIAGTNIGGSQEKPGELKKNYGFSIKGFKRLKFSPRDERFLKNILSKGYDEESKSRMDTRLLYALTYLANRHSYIKVSNIIYQYETMPVDFENTSNAQVQANISAHKSGQAVDIREIDFVYKGMDPMALCNNNEKDPRRALKWFNDRGSLLLTQECKGNIAQPMRGGPIIQGVSTKPIPIQIAWQDEPKKKTGSMAGTLRGSAEGLIERQLKLPPGSLDKSNGTNTLEQTGFSEIAQQLGVDPAIVKGKNPSDLFANLGTGGLADKLGLPLGSLKGSNLNKIMESTGQSSIEEAFNLPVGSWKGSNITSIAEAMGKSTIEKEFGLPEGTLNSPSAARAYLAQEAFSEDNINKIATEMNLPYNVVFQTINTVKGGKIDTEAIGNIGARRLERSLGIPDNTLDPYIAAAKNKDAINPMMVLGDLASIVKFEDIDVTVAGRQINIDKEQIKSILTKLGKGEDIKEAVKTLGGSQIDNSLYIEKGSTESFANNGDGDPMSQVNLIGDKLLKQAGTALFTGKFESFAKTYGKDFLQTGLQNGPRNMTVTIDDDTKTLFSKNPLQAAEKIAKDIFKINVGLSDQEINKLKGGKIQNISMIQDALINDFKWSQNEIDLLSDTDLTSLPSIESNLMKKYNLSSDDYDKFIKGDLSRMNIVQQETAKRTGIDQGDIEKIVNKDYKNTTLIKNILTGDLKWSKDKVEKTQNSEIIEVPQVKSRLGSLLKIAPTNWDKFKLGDLLGTSIIGNISKEKLNCTKTDADMLEQGQAKNVPAIKNPILGAKLTRQDLVLLKQGNIKDLPVVQNILKNNYKMSNDDIASLYGGNIKNISLVKSTLAGKFNLPSDEVDKLLSKDFKNMQYARNVISQKLKLSGDDLTNILGGNLGRVSIVQSEMAKNLKISPEEVNKLVDSNFKDFKALQGIVKDKLQLSDDDIKNILKGPALGNQSTINNIKNRLVNSGKANPTEASSVVAGDWLGSDTVKIDFSKFLKVDIADMDVIKLGQIGDLPIIRDIVMDNFNLDDMGLSNLTGGNWGELPVFQEGLSSSLNLKSGDVSNLLTGNLGNFSAIKEAFAGQFNMDNIDLQNITGRFDLSNLGPLKNFGEGFNLSTGSFSETLGGMGSAGDMINLGSTLGGGGLSPIGGGQDEVMKKVYRPEARYKVHQVIGELLDMTNKLNDPHMLVIQLITYSQGRDVDPFESKLENLYGKAMKNGGKRAENYGLFSMKEAQPNIHIGY